MQRLEDALDSLASRGDYAGAEAMIERLEESLASDADVRASFVTRPSARPRNRSGPSWMRGVAVATATMLVILSFGIGGIMFTGLFDTSSDLDVAATPTTSTITSELDLYEQFDGIVMAQQQTVSIVGDEGLSSERIVECCVTVALPDLRGGIVYQLRSDRIMWSRNPSSDLEEPTLVFEAGPGETISLESTDLLGGETTAVFLRDTGDRLILSTVELTTGRVVDVTELSPRVNRVSRTDSLFVVSLTSDADSWFEFRNEEGDIVDFPGNPRSESADSLVSQGVLSPSGNTMVFIERSRSDLDGGLADFVVWDLDTETEISRHPFASLGDEIVTFDGQRIVVLRQSANPGNPPIMVAFHLTANLMMTSTGGIGRIDLEG